MLQLKSNLSEKWQSSCSVDRAQPKHGFLSAQKHEAAIFICTSMTAEQRLRSTQGSNYHVLAYVHVHVCVCCTGLICSHAPPPFSHEKWRKTQEEWRYWSCSYWDEKEWKLFSCCSPPFLSFPSPPPHTPCLLCVIRQDELNQELNAPLYLSLLTPPPSQIYYANRSG